MEHILAHLKKVFYVSLLYKVHGVVVAGNKMPHQPLSISGPAW